MSFRSCAGTRCRGSASKHRLILLILVLLFVPVAGMNGSVDATAAMGTATAATMGASGKVQLLLLVVLPALCVLELSGPCCYPFHSLY